MDIYTYIYTYTYRLWLKMGCGSIQDVGQQTEATSVVIPTGLAIGFSKNRISAQPRHKRQEALHIEHRTEWPVLIALQRGSNTQSQRINKCGQNVNSITNLQHLWVRHDGADLIRRLSPTLQAASSKLYQVKELHTGIAAYSKNLTGLDGF